METIRYFAVAVRVVSFKPFDIITFMISPILGTDTLCSITMKGGVRPVTCAFCPAMFNRMPMNIIDMPVKVILVT
jgi:hypothetical protein